MSDPTEATRRALQAALNVGADRAALEAAYGRVWDTTELQTDYEVVGFLAPFVVARRRQDGAMGSLSFQHSPRFYFDWRPEGA